MAIALLVRTLLGMVRQWGFKSGAGGASTTTSAHLFTHPGLARAVRDYLTNEREVHLKNAQMTELAWT